MSYTFEYARRIQFALPFETGRTIDIGEKVYLSLPHQTNGTNRIAVVESRTIDLTRKQENVKFTVRLYPADTSEFAYYIQDTCGAGVQPDWQDHMQTKTERGSGGNDIQDVQ